MHVYFAIHACTVLIYKYCNYKYCFPEWAVVSKISVQFRAPQQFYNAQSSCNEARVWPQLNSHRLSYQLRTGSNFDENWRVFACLTLSSHLSSTLMQLSFDSLRNECWENSHANFRLLTLSNSHSCSTKGITVSCFLKLFYICNRISMDCKLL